MIKVKKNLVVRIASVDSSIRKFSDCNRCFVDDVSSHKHCPLNSHDVDVCVCISAREKENKKSGSKLLSCPFCGYKPILFCMREDYRKVVLYSVQCNNCTARKWRYYSRSSAISTWNQRVKK